MNGVGNPYLESLKGQYKSLNESIKGLQTRASEAKRTLTTDELESVAKMGEEAEKLAAQIESLSQIELRNANVNAMNARVEAAMRNVRSSNGFGAAEDDGAEDGAEGDGGGQDGGEGGAVETRSTNVGTGGARTTLRDPGHYVLGGRHSYMGDHFRAQILQDRNAQRRLAEHTVALVDMARSNKHLRDVLGAGATTGGAGLVPPVWLAEQFAPILHKGLRVATVLRQIPWPGSPFAWSIPVAGSNANTSTVAEGVNATETDPNYSVLTVTPQAIMGYSEVSRQMLEASNPAVDAVIWGDLNGDFYDKAETAVITALNAQANVNTVTVSAGVATTADIIAQRNGILDGISAVSDNNAGDATVFVGRQSRWTTYLKFVDSTGRPLILAQAYNPQNAIGRGDNTMGFRSPIQGTLENLLAVTSPTVAASTGFIINPDEILFSLSPPMQFSFEQPAGPALIRIGVWGYEAVVTGRRPKAITKVSYSGS